MLEADMEVMLGLPSLGEGYVGGVQPPPWPPYIHLIGGSGQVLLVNLLSILVSLLVS